MTHNETERAVEKSVQTRTGVYEPFGYGTLRHLLNKCTIMWIFSGVAK